MRTLRFFLCLFLSVSFFSAYGAAWAEDTGHIRLQIQAPDNFKSSIMINLIKDDINTLLVAEPINQYKITQDVPAGTYHVDFVAADPYTVTYPKAVTVPPGQTAALPIQISAPHQKSTMPPADGPTASKGSPPATETDPKPATSKAKSGQELAWTLVRQAGTSFLILIAGGIGYILIKKRKEE